MSVYDNLKAHGIVLPKALTPAGLYLPVSQTGNLLYVSGQGSVENGRPLIGRLGEALTVQEGQYAAAACMINTLSALHAYLGDLDRIRKVVKILGFIAGTDDFQGQATVLDGASQILIAAFGENGRHARSAIGTNSLPLGLAVEVESIFEIAQ